MSDLKAALLALQIVKDFEVSPGITVRIRELSRDQILQVNQKYDVETQAIEVNNELVSLALVDPVVTPDEVQALFASLPFSISEKLNKAIGEVNGWAQGADREAMATFPEQP
jgi:hypothetical protein